MQAGLKEELLKSCHQFVDERIGTIENAMHNAQSAANEETKSSAGDKYETGRAMMHLEKEKLAGQLSEASKMKRALDQIDGQKADSKVQLGSVVKTAAANYFISASVGKLIVQGETFFAVSPMSPVGQQLLGKQAGSTFTFAAKSIVIKEVY